MSAAQQLELLAAPREAPRTPPLHRRRDPETSRDAAARVAVKLNALQQRVMSAFAVKPMTAAEAERLPGFHDLGPSTVRKRISELAKPPLCRLIATGAKRDGCAEWREATPDETARMRAEAGCP